MSNRWREKRTSNGIQRYMWYVFIYPWTAENILKLPIDEKNMYIMMNITQASIKLIMF